MTGWLIALGILILLAILPIGASLIYNEDGPLVRVIVGFIPIKVFPQKKENKKDKEPPAQAQKKKKDNKPAKNKEPSEVPGTVSDFMPYIKISLQFLDSVRKKLRVKLLELKVVMAGGDPCDLGTNYGRVWAAIGNIMPQLERFLVIKKRNINVCCDFEADDMLIYARAELRITFARALSLVTVNAIRAIKVYIKNKNKGKGGSSL